MGSVDGVQDLGGFKSTLAKEQEEAFRWTAALLQAKDEIHREDSPSRGVGVGVGGAEEARLFSTIAELKLGEIKLEDHEGEEC